MKSTTIVFISSLFIAFLMLNGCNNAESTKTTAATESTPAFDLTNAKKEIEGANQNFMDMLAKGDSVGLANGYTTDGELMFDGAPSIVGRPAIQSAFSGIINSGITKADMKTKNVYGNEDMVAEEGVVNLYVKDQNVAEEKYIVLWKKEDGKWKMFRDISNSNLPAPASK
jgi:ketosteroid isomerase-like protein